LGDVPSQLEKIRQAVEQHEAKSLHAAAHALKGAAGCLGGDQVASAARRLEAIGERADFSEAAEAFATLEREIQRLIDVVSGYVLQPQD
jgi:HPt (histidine-containing phosphotransfer) domain-containing protein